MIKLPGLFASLAGHVPAESLECGHFQASEGIYPGRAKKKLGVSN
jgi:hypothetical protein